MRKMGYLIAAIVVALFVASFPVCSQEVNSSSPKVRVMLRVEAGPDKLVEVNDSTVGFTPREVFVASGDRLRLRDPVWGTFGVTYIVVDNPDTLRFTMEGPKQYLQIDSGKNELVGLDASTDEGLRVLKMLSSEELSTVLWIKANLSNLSVLKQLPSLSQISAPVGLTNGDLAALCSNHPSLTVLDLRNRDRISDLSPLADLESLIVLDLEDCDNVTDLSPLAGLESLIHLDLEGCDRVTDLSPLAGLESLVWLDLEDCENIVDLSPLAGLKSLTELDLEQCSRVNDLSPLANLKSLVFLKVEGCDALDESDIRELQAKLPRCVIEYDD